MKKEIKDFTVIDLETTGFYPNNRIIEFGAVKYRDGKPVDTFQQYAKYQGKLPDVIKKVTGITEEILKEKGIHKDEAYNKMIEFIGDDILVAHNMDFDWGFLEFHNPLCKETGKPIHKLNNKKHCTLKIARKLKLNVQNNKLETLCKHYKITPERFHSAICDAQATGELFLRLQDENNYNIEPNKTKTSRTIPVITLGEMVNEAFNSELDVPLKTNNILESENVKIDPEPTINTKTNINIPIKKQIITGREIPVEELERLERTNVSIWGFTLGWLGLHNFKYGYYLKGFIQLLISILSCGLLAIVSWIWAIIESILILNNKIQPNPKKNEFMEKIFNYKKNN